MENEELSKRISELESELVRLKQLINAEASLAKAEPSIFERFPVGSYLCGMKVLGHDDDEMPFKLLYDSSDVWIEEAAIVALADCHDWIEKYHPFLEKYRKEWEYMEGSPVLQHAIAAQKVGLWANKTPVKKPWEEK